MGWSSWVEKSLEEADDVLLSLKQGTAAQPVHRNFPAAMPTACQNSAWHTGIPCPPWVKPRVCRRAAGVGRSAVRLVPSPGRVCAALLRACPARMPARPPLTATFPVNSCITSVLLSPLCIRTQYKACGTLLVAGGPGQPRKVHPGSPARGPWPESPSH